MTGTTGGLSKSDGAPEGFCACPVDAAFRVVGKKWTILLIRNLLRGDRHFNEFLAHIRGLNPKTLSSRLKELEHEKLLVKRVVRSTPVSIEYDLTKKGHAVLPILSQMAHWSMQWAPERVFPAGKPPVDVQRCMEEWQAWVTFSDARPEARIASRVTLAGAANPRRRRPASVL